LIEGLGAKRSSSGWAARCPAHDDRNPSLSINIRDGRVLVYCHTGCPQDAVIDELRHLDLWPSFDRREYRGQRPPMPRPVPLPPIIPNDTKMRDFGLRIWSEAMPLSEGNWATTLRCYFDSRGLEQFEPCQALRFHPRMPHGGGVFLPAMLAL